jgi:hypothetical protein
VAEWSIASHSKCEVRASVPGVRISPSPPFFRIGHPRIADQSGSTAFVYNALGQIITDIRVIAAKIYRPMSNLLTSLAHGNGLVTTAGYDLDYRLTSLQLKDGVLPVSSLAYAYGDNLNLTGITDGVTAANSNVLSYSATNRLKQRGRFPLIATFTLHPTEG